ncbi:hypothetical protein CONPUDRAFT_83081 [Coniophora puteana RWD-64-598 SS2]|uniref:Uncharacterized protein n=1 Tax=Coniophora puteana (strain RWD-64-598) TaxID=741705 RepID=A0A5M3ML87_CONPW|nr:uncharacterized protein CONPUDRAFT_83081 [Coniophora puteana RWD-64-598 SS2]EIW79787.1 hypothetical protein CONPUDRAFT_83081 [Coniophora puteana RWD-64-598 SS2]
MRFNRRRPSSFWKLSPHKHARKMQPRAGSRVGAEGSMLQLHEASPHSTTAQDPSQEKVDYRMPTIVFAGALSILSFIRSVSWLKEPFPSDILDGAFAVLSIASFTPACLLELFGAKAALQRRLDHMSLYTKASVFVKGTAVAVCTLRLFIVWVIGDTCPHSKFSCFGQYGWSIATQSWLLILQAFFCCMSIKFAFEYRLQLLHPSERSKDVGLAEQGQYESLIDTPGCMKHQAMGDQDEEFEDEFVPSTSSSTGPPPAYEAA